MLPITEEHASQAAFLWTRREVAAGASHYRLADLAELDERVEAHLDGVRLAGTEGAGVAKRLVDAEEAGAVFVAADRALEAQDARAFAGLLDATAEGGVEPLIAALAWRPLAKSAWAVKALLHANCPPALHRIGIAAKVAHREDPGEPLVHALWGDDPELRKEGLFGLGALGKKDLLTLAQEDYAQADPAVRLEAARSGLLLGDRKAIEVLGGLVQSPRRRDALGLMVRVTDSADAVRAVEGLANEDRRAAIDAMEASLDVRWIPWLLECLARPELARLAARALGTLTGVAVSGGMVGAAPEGFRAGPTDDPNDGDAGPDPDAHLAWPAPAFARRVEEAVKGQKGRIFWGKPLTLDTLAPVLRDGTQRERSSAATEIALARPGSPLVEVRAPGFRQGVG